MKSTEIRHRFLDYFERNGHTVVPSAPLPFDDPNLLFVVAGMTQFVPYFVGQQTAPWQRATSVQKCIRTPDIDEVGKTTRHGTFFQMNGNFSFGDYFKHEAIRYAWELSTSPVSDGGFGLDADRIWPTVYLEDDEAFDIWQREIGVPGERIIRRGKADNTWDMGIPGPAGTCSELFYDRGPDYGRDGGPEADEDRFLEFWNLVFMQYERGASTGPNKGDYDIVGQLPRPNIDTGMGLERMAALLQGVDNIYEIDETRPVLNRAAELAGKVYGAHSGHAASQSHRDDVQLRVDADHVRTSLMLIGDGVTPSNEGRGYVLRRILRRAVRAMRLLGVDEPVLPELLPVSRDCMSPSYPHLQTDYERIAMIGYAEEEAFRRTLASGTKIFDTAVRDVRSTAGVGLSADSAFRLHDTYGFPIELTLEMAAEQGLTVDEAGFRTLMIEQRRRAKDDNRAKKTAHADVSVLRSLREQGETPFTGYTELQTDTRVRGLILDNALVPAAHEGQTVDVVLGRTPFYPEGGGQIADEGVIRVEGAVLRVLDVQRPLKGLIAHRVLVEQGEVVSGASALAVVDHEWRTAARQAHSGTHIVHAALRQVLGPAALQSGSYNRPGYLRLDFAWGRALTTQNRRDIEDVANIVLRRDLPVSVLHLPLQQARELGALALFGETYDDIVRVVEIGGEWSRELCGGTHVEHSSQVGIIALVSDSSVGSGLRRVEAYVGLEAVRRYAAERTLIAGLSEALKVPTDQLPGRVSALVARVKDAEREAGQLRVAHVLESAPALRAAAESIGEVQVVATQVPAGVSGSDLRSLAMDVAGRLTTAQPAVVLLASANEANGATFVCVVNEAGRTAGLSAHESVRTLAQLLGARGGGKPELAQGAGGDVGRLTDALADVKRAVAEQVIQT